MQALRDRKRPSDKADGMYPLQGHDVRRKEMISDFRYIRHKFQIADLRLQINLKFEICNLKLSINERRNDC